MTSASSRRGRGELGPGGPPGAGGAGSRGRRVGVGVGIKRCVDRGLPGLLEIGFVFRPLGRAQHVSCDPLWFPPIRSLRCTTETATVPSLQQGPEAPAMLEAPHPLPSPNRSQRSLPSSGPWVQLGMRPQPFHSIPFMTRVQTIGVFTSRKTSQMSRKTSHNAEFRYSLYCTVQHSRRVPLTHCLLID